MAPITEEHFTATRRRLSMSGKCLVTRRTSGETPMNQFAFARAGLLGALALAAASVAPSVASAGSCPADKTGVNLRAPDKTRAKGVTDNVIASSDVAKVPVHIDGRLFRLRRLVIQPGGVVPWHSHGDRPAIIYIERGEVTEYASTCSV